ncbi:hypothetical protein LTR09_001391 [Extremus antarcticus]|uniref:Uncharacterized protein n=1 Tax=Extremus antarcticus TaxID=702011 RepID=A0AAJ0LWY6_9PEZI|nr:hypothetical protein LTR09_001391 [Extremus antarcticus]
MLRYMEFTVSPGDMRDMNRLNCYFDGADLDRLARVSSLYGPGTVSCWLCTVTSVFISWTLNKRTISEDTITNDLLACLSFPIVAAGHLLHQVATFPGNRSSILTTNDPVLLPWAAAIQASLTICEIAAPMALALFAISTITMQKKRCYCAAGTALLAFSAESGLFVVSPRAPIDQSNLSRPFLLNRSPWMILFMVVTFGYAIVALVIWLRTSSTTFEHMRETRVGERRREDPERAVLARLRTRRLWTYQEAGLYLVSGFAILYTPIAFATFTSFPLGAWGTTALGTMHSIAWRLRFFAPESTCRITDLDQAVALAGGVATLAFSCYDALIARSRTVHAAER